MTKPNHHVSLTLQQTASGLNVILPAGDEIQLHGLDAMVLAAANGSNDLATILDLVRRDLDPSATREMVFASLDRLSDAGLMASRIAPPAGGNATTRRDMLRLVGAAAACAVMTPAGSAFAQASDILRAGEEHRKDFRAAEEARKLEMQELRAAEETAKLEWRASEQTVKVERRDVIDAERNLNALERELSAAERDNKGQPSNSAEETVKKLEREVQLASRVAEQEQKQFAAAETRAAETKEKAILTRQSEETAKKTNRSEAARARHDGGGGSAGEAAAKAAEALAKALP